LRTIYAATMVRKVRRVVGLFIGADDDRSVRGVRRPVTLGPAE